MAKPRAGGPPPETPEGSSNPALARARKRIQQQIEDQEAEQRRRRFRQRIEIANAGVRAYQAKRITEAVQSFQQYIKVLEDHKGVGEGGLSPSHFDMRMDAAELLLISGIYWDLTKLYDRTKTVSRQKEFHRYMEKFILFSKGMAYEPVCAETLRKYIAMEKPVHRDDFRNAYRILTGGRCFVATALADVTLPETAIRLRRLRDLRLRRSRAGRALVKRYYRWSPPVARACADLPRPFRRGLGVALDALAWVAERVLI